MLRTPNPLPKRSNSFAILDIRFALATTQPRTKDRFLPIAICCYVKQAEGKASRTPLRLPPCLPFYLVTSAPTGFGRSYGTGQWTACTYLYSCTFRTISSLISLLAYVFYPRSSYCPQAIFPSLILGSDRTGKRGLRLSLARVQRGTLLRLVRYCCLRWHVYGLLSIYDQAPESVWKLAVRSGSEMVVVVVEERYNDYVRVDWCRE